MGNRRRGLTTVAEVVEPTTEKADATPEARLKLGTTETAPAPRGMLGVTPENRMMHPRRGTTEPTPTPSGNRATPKTEVPRQMVESTHGTTGKVPRGIVLQHPRHPRRRLGESEMVGRSYTFLASCVIAEVSVRIAFTHT